MEDPKAGMITFENILVCLLVSSFGLAALLLLLKKKSCNRRVVEAQDMSVPSQSYCLVSFVGSSVRENTGSRFKKILISHGNVIFGLLQGNTYETGFIWIACCVCPESTEQLRLERTSADSLVQWPALQAGSAGAGCSAPWLDGSQLSPKMGIPASLGKAVPVFDCCCGTKRM